MIFVKGQESQIRPTIFVRAHDKFSNGSTILQAKTQH